MPKHIVSLRSVGYENICKFIQEINAFTPSADLKISDKKIINLLMAQESKDFASIYTKSLAPLGLNLIPFSPSEWSFDKESPQNGSLKSIADADLQIVYGLPQNDLEVFCDNVKGKVLNALNDTSNLCAALGDLSLIHSMTPEFDKIRISWIGGSTPLANSLIEASMFIPFELFMALPVDQEPNRDLIAFALSAGAKIFLTRDIKIAIDEANYIYFGNLSAKNIHNSFDTDGEIKLSMEENSSTVDYIKQVIKENSDANVKFLVGADNSIPDQIDMPWVEEQDKLYKKQIINNINAQTCVLSWLLAE